MDRQTQVREAAVTLSDWLDTRREVVATVRDEHNHVTVTASAKTLHHRCRCGFEHIMDDNATNAGEWLAAFDAHIVAAIIAALRADADGLVVVDADDLRAVVGRSHTVTCSAARGMERDCHCAYGRLRAVLGAGADEEER